MFVHRNKFQIAAKQNAKFLEFTYFYRRCTSFRRFLRPSSGAHNCTHSFRYCQPILLLAATVMKMEFHLFHGSSYEQYWLTVPEAVCTVMCSWWWEEEPSETYRTSIKINKLKKHFILFVVIWNSHNQNRQHLLWFQGNNIYKKTPWYISLFYSQALFFGHVVRTRGTRGFRVFPSFSVYLFKAL
jgi:hypothetical protein